MLPVVDGGMRDKPAPMRPAPRGTQVRRRFTRRAANPRGIAWYGFRSLWGHLRHFAASAIASDGIDGREWMRPDSPEELAGRIARRIRAPHPEAPTLVEAVGGDFWIDYLADTGEHAGVTRAVAHLIGHEAFLPDPEDPERELLAPRGSLLIFGGDTAYPVATAQEIHDRVVVPFNRALYDIGEDGVARAMLGIPGNHDWYDGLDGFSRLFRFKRYEEDDAVVPSTMKSGDTSIGTAVELVKNIMVGESREKAEAMVIHGYRAMQSASYWALHLAPGLWLLGGDRQLRKVDAQQRRFFRLVRQRAGRVARYWALLPDPLNHFGRRSETGADTVAALGLDPEVDDAFLLSGDIHHYRRERIGEALHVTAGGGGAFLHPAPIGDSGERNPAEVEWPDRVQSQALLRKVPGHVALGRAGLIPQVVMALLYAPFLGVGGWWFGHDGLGPATVIAGVVTAILYAFLGGIRHGPFLPIAALSATAGALTSLVPMGALALFGFAARQWELAPNALLGATVALFAAMVMGGFVFGGFFAATTRLGLEETQAFTALAHPGFKHFIRFRVRADGSAVDGWVIGLADPLADRFEPVLVDRFTWRAKGSAARSAAPAAADRAGAADATWVDPPRD